MEVDEAGNGHFVVLNDAGPRLTPRSELAGRGNVH
jgi:hypothetical protein